jgi:excisionase family DNA binding protein
MPGDLMEQGKPTIQTLAVSVIADPRAAATLTRDDAIAVAGVLAAAQTAVQAQALRAPEAVAPVTPAKFVERLTVTTAEAAEWLGLDDTHLQDLCRRGVIPASKPGKAYLIRVDAIREWLVTQEEARRARRGATPAPPAASRRRVAVRLDALPRNSRRSA